MPKLYDASNDQSLGPISQQDLELLMRQLDDAATTKPRGYCVTNETFLALVDAGASSMLLDAVKAALARGAEAQIRWQAN